MCGATAIATAMAIRRKQLIADHPPVMTGIDRDDLRRFVLGDASVRVLDVDLAAREKADMRVHAAIGADHRLHRC